MKFLFALWDGGGAVPPELGVARRLIARDHEVRILADPTLRDQAVALGAGFTPWAAAPHRTTGLASEGLVKGLGGAQSDQHAGPHSRSSSRRAAAAIAADTAAELTDHTPDIVVADYFLFGALIPAQAAGLPVAALVPKGQLGCGGQSGSAASVKVSRLTDVTAIAAAPFNAYALRKDGTVWAWGSGELNALGVSTREPSLPVQVPGLTGVTEIAAGELNAYAVRGDGTACAWGIGDGNPGNTEYSWTSAPVAVPDLAGITAIAASRRTGYALGDAGQVWAWGEGRLGQFGADSDSDRSTVPVLVPLDGVTALGGGLDTAYAVR